jgi:hypothetical protein
VTQPKQASKRKRRSKTVQVLGAAGLLSLAGGSAATQAAPAADIPARHIEPSHEFTLSEEEVSDVSLATFYVFDKERALRPGVQLVRGGGCGGGGCGCRGCGGGGCGGRGCGCLRGCGGCGGCAALGLGLGLLGLALGGCGGCGGYYYGGCGGGYYYGGCGGGYYYGGCGGGYYGGCGGYNY